MPEILALYASGGKRAAFLRPATCSKPPLRPEKIFSSPRNFVVKSDPKGSRIAWAASVACPSDTATYFIVLPMALWPGHCCSRARLTLPAARCDAPGGNSGSDVPESPLVRKSGGYFLEFDHVQAARASHPGALNLTKQL